MNKSDLVASVMREAEVTRRQATAAIDAIVEDIVHAMSKGDVVQIKGFGTFRAPFHKAAVRRNPRTGEAMDVPERRVPKLRFSRSVGREVNGR